MVLEDLVGFFLAHGFHRFGLDDLAARAHCSKSTLYALAGSKEQLVALCVEHFFRRSARRVEATVAAVATPTERLRAYLLAVAAELDAASQGFLDDLAANPVTRQSYERHTRFAADRVRALVAEGVERGDFDPVHATFLGEVATATMDAIERGGVSARTGLSHAEAYGALADVVLAAAGAGRPRKGERTPP